MKYHVRQSDVTPYSPANHSGTRNFRLIGPETVGASQVMRPLVQGGQGVGGIPDALQ